MRRRTVAVLDTLPGAHACAASAALIHRLPLLTVPAGVEVASQPAKRTGRPGLSARPAWGHDPVRRDGVLVQTMADTVIEVAGRHGCETGLMVADAALHSGLDAAALDESLDLYDHRVGVTAARTIVALADARIESPGESRVRWVCHTVGIVLEPQFPLRDEWGHVFARADFRVAGTNVLVEFDGLLKYSDPAALRAEKARQLRLERLGYRVVRLTWRDLDRPGPVVAMIREAISRAA